MFIREHNTLDLRPLDKEGDAVLYPGDLVTLQPPPGFEITDIIGIVISTNGAYVHPANGRVVVVVTVMWPNDPLPLAPFVFAPYVPLQVTPTVFAPNDFTKRKFSLTGK